MHTSQPCLHGSGLVKAGSCRLSLESLCPQQHLSGTCLAQLLASPCFCAVALVRLNVLALRLVLSSLDVLGVTWIPYRHGMAVVWCTWHHMSYEIICRLLYRLNNDFIVLVQVWLRSFGEVLCLYTSQKPKNVIFGHQAPTAGVIRHQARTAGGSQGARKERFILW